MSDNIGNNKRIAKNTVALYVRMLISTFVTLYTSRVVLDVLGVDDFGVFGVVGGVVGMLGFLNAAMAGSTSRFLTYELVNNNQKKLQDTFSSAFIIHALIALTIALLSETIGLWFLNNKLVIPEGRMIAARWVLHFSVMDAVLGIIMVPYNAVIFAHEKMNFYAYVEILRVVLKLAIVYLLTIGNMDKLILYAFLGLCVHIIIVLIYFFYCTYHFKESRFRYVWDKSILVPMLSFSGWNMFKSICVTIRRQGTNFVVNIFFGVALNAASSVATSVDGVFKGLTDSIVHASSPQIIKMYAQRRLSEMQSLMIRVFKMAAILMGLLLSPLYICINDVLQIWLKEPPVYTDVFCKILLISSFFAMVSNVLFWGIIATGNIKTVSIVNGVLYVIDVVIVYLLFRLGCAPETSYYVLCIVNILVFFSDLVFLKRNINYIRVSKFILCLLQSISVILLAGWLVQVFYSFLGNPFVRILVVALSNAVLLVVFSSVLVFNKSERQFVVNYIKSRFKK